MAVWPRSLRSHAIGVWWCFTEFTKPVQLYLTGDQASSGAYSNAWAEGVVPDSVVAIAVLMANGVSVPAPISDNAFRVPVPAGVGVSGYTVRLRNGQTQEDSDPRGAPEPGNALGQQRAAG